MNLPRNVYIALGAVAALAVAFAAGRYSTPTRVELRTEWLTRVQTVRTTRVERVTDTKYKRVIVKQPDGSSIETETGEIHESTKTAENTKSDETGKEVTKSVTSHAPQWSIFVSGGVVFPTAGTSSGGFTASLAPTVGIEVHRRLIGPTWGGVWFRALGGPPSGGLSIGLEF